MQYGPIAETLLERVALWLGRVPVPLMDALFSIMKARGLMAAVSLGIFEALAKNPRTAHDLSRDLNLDHTTLELLLRSLVAAGYLRIDGSRFRLSPLSAKTMIPGAPMELAGFVRWNYVQWRMV